jgi:hypothetical protein
MCTAHGVTRTVSRGKACHRSLTNTFHFPVPLVLVTNGKMFPCLGPSTCRSGLSPSRGGGVSHTYFVKTHRNSDSYEVRGTVEVDLDVLRGIAVRGRSVTQVVCGPCHEPLLSQTSKFWDLDLGFGIWDSRSSGLVGLCTGDGQSCLGSTSGYCVPLRRQPTEKRNLISDASYRLPR